MPSEDYRNMLQIKLQKKYTLSAQGLKVRFKISEARAQALLNRAYNEGYLTKTYNDTYKFK